MMKSFFKKLAFVMALAMVVSLAAPAATTAAAAEALQIKYQNGVDTPSEINIAKVGAVEDLKFTGAPDYKEAGFEWTSSNPAVATVNQKGEVTAVAAGTAEVTITVGDRQDTVKVNVVDLPTYTATMGINSKDLKTEITLEVGGEVDFGFFGIKDYDRNRYQCNWFEAGDGSVATVDKNGVIKAVGAGTTVISLGVYNVVTGMKHSVASCTVTVKGEEPVATPVPEQSIEATQTTYKKVVVDLSNMPEVEAADFEVYAVYGEDTNGNLLETVWQTIDVSIDEDKDEATLTGYYAFEDGQDYIVRVGEVEDTFTASVGAVAKVTLGYNSYKNNQNNWAFPGRAVTNGLDGEEIVTYLNYKLTDAKGIDVTGYYDDPVRYELVNYDSNLVNLDSYNGTLTFNEVGAVAKIKAIYNDDIESTVAPIIGEQAPAYQVVKIDEWSIVRAANHANGDKVKAVWASPIHSIALYDDNDDNTVDAQECDYWIVAKFVDNYGNKYVTDSNFVDTVNKYYAMDEDDKFIYEGYEVRFESSNPQVLVISEDTGLITTKRTGNASINAYLYNDLTGTNYVKRISVLTANVKQQRVLSSITVNTVDVTTDTLETSAYKKDFIEGTATIVLKDQYGDNWGAYNSYRATSTDVVVTSKKDVATIGETTTTYNADKIEIKFNGVDLKADVNDATVKNVYYTVEATDTLTGVVRKAEFRVDLNNPAYNKNTSEMIVSDRLTLSADNTGLINTNWWEYGPKHTTIKLTETSNGLSINYVDDVKLVTDSTDWTDAAFVTAVSEGDIKYALVVTDAAGNIIPLASANDGLGLEVLTDGLYNFHVSAADANNELSFMDLGKYTVKVCPVVLNADKNKVVAKSASYKKVISVTDNRTYGSLVAQNKIDTEEYAIEDIVVDAFTFKTNEDLKAGKGYQSYIDGVEYRQNLNATAVIIEEVYLKVFVGDSDYYYVVKVPVYKTVGTN